MYHQHYFMCKIRITLNALGKAFFFVLISYLNGAENSKKIIYTTCTICLYNSLNE